MRKLIYILLSTSLILTCGCSKKIPESSTSLSIVAISSANNTLTYRLRNNLKESILVQVDKESNIPIYQLRYEKGENTATAIGHEEQSSLLKNILIEPGTYQEYRYSFGVNRPVKFKAGVRYKRNSQSEEELVWSDWYSAL
ncbi:MAG: hypothetical protein DRI44_01320 [Chlamydiae bacterium]|nr:MAG: hypothetical protein DRI44_01320 [Chlamydiota bacterium]